MNRWVKFNKELTLQTLPYVIGYLATFFFIGLGILITADFDWRVFGTAAFWYTTGSTLFATLLMFLSRFMHKTNAKRRVKYKTETIEKEGNEVVVEHEIDTDYTLNERLITNFAREDNEDLEEFLKIENRERKIDEWRTAVSERLENHLAKQKPNDYIALVNGQRNKWVAKYEQIKEKMTDAYINSNIDTLNVDYDIVTRSLITSGCLTPKKRKRKSRKDYVSTNRFGKVWQDIAPKYALSVASTLFFSAFVFEAVQGKVENLTVFFFKALLLAWNFALGDDYANLWHREITLNDQQFRIEMIKKYKLWKKKRG